MYLYCNSSDDVIWDAFAHAAHASQLAYMYIQYVGHTYTVIPVMM